LIPVRHAEKCTSFFSSAASGKFRHSYAGSWIPSHINHHPSSFSVSAGSNLHDYSRKKSNREYCNDQGGEGIYVVNPPVRIAGSICLALAVSLGWLGTWSLFRYDGWRGACIGLFVFISGRWCLICGERDGKEEESCDDGQKWFHSDYLNP